MAPAASPSDPFLFHACYDIEEPFYHNHSRMYPIIILRLVLGSAQALGIPLIPHSYTLNFHYTRLLRFSSLALALARVSVSCTRPHQ